MKTKKQKIKYVVTRPQTFGQRVRKYRELLGLSENRLSKIMDVSIATVSFYEHDKKLPNGKNLLKLAETLNVSPYILLFGAKDYPIELIFDTVKAMKLADKSSVIELVATIVRRNKMKVTQEYLSVF